LSCHCYTRLLVVLIGHGNSLLYSQVNLGLYLVFVQKRRVSIR